MPFYEINWTKFGTALIEADNEDEAFDFLYHEIDYDQADLETVLENRPQRTDAFDPVSLG